MRCYLLGFRENRWVSPRKIGPGRTRRARVCPRTALRTQTGGVVTPASERQGTTGSRPDADSMRWRAALRAPPSIERRSTELSRRSQRLSGPRSSLRCHRLYPGPPLHGPLKTPERRPRQMPHPRNPTAPWRPELGFIGSCKHQDLRAVRPSASTERLAASMPQPLPKGQRLFPEPQQSTNPEKTPSKCTKRGFFSFFFSCRARRKAAGCHGRGRRRHVGPYHPVPVHERSWRE